MSEEKNNKLPVEVKSKNLDINTHNFQRKFKEIAQRVGKCALWGGIGILGMGAFALGSPVVATTIGMNALVTPIVSTVGMSTVILGTFNLQKNFRFRRFSDLMFASQRKIKNDTIRISQVSDPILKSKMKKLDKMQKGSLMALQTLVGLERYKRELEEGNKAKEQSEKSGICIYMQKFSTRTHGINIKNMKSLEQLGYIKIDTDLESAPKKESQLIIERLGFGQTREVIQSIGAMIKGDKETLEKNKVDMQEIEFRLTDKHINFEELYKLCNDKSQGNGLKTPVRRLAPIFSNKYGLLKTQNIDIQYDKYNMPRIIYGSKEPFADRISKENSRNSSNNFIEELAKWKTEPQQEWKQIRDDNIKDNELTSRLKSLDKEMDI